MIELVNYLLAFSGFTILVLAFLFPPTERDAPFVRISVTFMVVFFVIPAFLFMQSGGYEYLGKFRAVDDYKLLNTLFSFHVFLVGFFFIGQRSIKISTHTGAPIPKQTTPQRPRIAHISKKRLLILAIIAALVFFLNEAMRPDLETLYEVRRGTKQMSPMLLLLSNVSQTVVMSLLFLLIAMRWRIFALALLIALFLSKLDASSGRTSMLLLLAVAGIFIFQLRASTAALIIPIFVFLGMPILLIGKEIIYFVSTNRSMPDLSMMLGSVDDYAFLYFQNFAHPFISMYEVFGTLDIVGLRLFYDFPHGFLFYLKVFGLDFGSSLTYFNTQNLMGIHQSIIPTGYLAFGFVQAGYLGVIMMGLFFRYCFRFLSATMLFRIARSETLVFYISFAAANTFYTGEMRTLVLGFFLPLMLMHLIGEFVVTNRPSKKRYPKP